METIHILPYTHAAITRCGRNHAQNMHVSAISADPAKLSDYDSRPDCTICPECMNGESVADYCARVSAALDTAIANMRATRIA